ncbi:thiamine diphosphokinase [Desulfovibrionales bacterium]
MHWVLVANGAFVCTPDLKHVLDTADCVVGVDGGCCHVEVLGRNPDLVLGDLDSVPAELVALYEEQSIEIIRHRVDKDFTDLELALELAMERGATRITVLGATGGRVDHFLANIFALTRCVEHGIPACIRDEAQSITVVDRELMLQGCIGDIVTVLPLTEQADNVWLHGMCYPLHGETLFFGSSRGVSNVLSAPQAQITVGSGRVLVIHRRV